MLLLLLLLLSLFVFVFVFVFVYPCIQKEYMGGARLGGVGWGGVGLLIPISRESKEKDVVAMLDELAIVSS